MWVIEVNIAGYRFTREMPDLRPINRRPFLFTPRGLHWPIVRHSHAA